MTYELTVDEKRSIITNQMRNAAYRKYVAQIELIAEKAVDAPVASKITELNNEVSKCDDQLAALTVELNKLG